MSCFLARLAFATIRRHFCKLAEEGATRSNTLPSVGRLPGLTGNLQVECAGGEGTCAIVC
jgi:hypothetical protein